MLSGDTFGKYRLVSRLGQGGMGEVWIATASGHGGFTKRVVIKTLLPEYARDPLFIEMLAHEARICAQLSHPNLIEVFDFAEYDGIYLLAMEYVGGRPLHQIVRAAKERSWSIPAWFALRVAWECCRGLECAHDQGVIHCDLSPSNVMVTFTGVTKILDFGVAHSMSRGPKADRLKGKVAYIAPERIKSLATDARSDIYSLGVMLYLVFTGQLPFTGATDRELLQNIVKTRPRPPSELAPVDSRLERLILRAMQPDPAKRYQSMREMLEDLTPCLQGQLGTYGQQDVANFVTRLFAPEAERAEHAFATSRQPAADDASEVMTRAPAAWFSPDEVKDLGDFDIDVASSVLEIPVAAAASPPPPPTPSPHVVRFARGSEANPPIERPRTSVHTLFVDRPSGVTRDVSRLFDRATLEEPERRGGFGSYSSTRSDRPTAWPWTSSRTKSD